MDVSALLDTYLAKSSAKIVCIGSEQATFEYLQNYLSLKLQYTEEHPDVMLLKPEGTHQAVRIEQIRSVLERISVRPFYDRYYIVVSAQGLNAHSYNALLKTLEESQNAAFFLCYTHQEAVPATIHSRCVTVLMPACAPVPSGLPSDLMSLSWSSVLTHADMYAEKYEHLGSWLDDLWFAVTTLKKEYYCAGRLSLNAVGALDRYIDDLLEMKAWQSKQSSLHTKKGIDRSLIRWLLCRSFL